MPHFLVTLAMLGLLSSSLAWAAPDEIQVKVVRAYSEGNCARVVQLTNRLNYERFRPNVIAVTAACQTDAALAERMFKRAEELNPTGDLILVLHAKYLWSIDRKRSKELFETLLRVARNATFREMAKGAIEDRAPPAGTLNLSSSTIFVKAQLGGAYRTDPRRPEFVFEPTRESYAELVNGEMGWKRWYRFGSLAATARLYHEHYFSAQHLDWLEGRFDTPVALQVGASQDIIFRPGVSYIRVGGKPYQFSYGLAVRGVVYRPTYTQSVQGMVFRDRVYNPTLDPEDGAHYRFSYQWDFFPSHWLFEAQIAVEHVSASRVSSYLGALGDFEMSHTDPGAAFKAERVFGRYSLAFEPSVVYRVDSLPSSYSGKAPEGLVVKRRQDLRVQARATASMALMRGLVLSSWYEWLRVYSNLRSTDYVDRAMISHTVSVGVSTSFSTY